MGHCKFATPSGTDYIIWNCNRLPQEISAKEVLVTDTYGEKQVIPTKGVWGSDTSVFIELVL